MRILLLIFLLGLPITVGAEDQSAGPGQELSLENFAEDSVGTFPARWKVRGDENEARAIYKVASESDKHFLHAYTKDQGVQIGLTHLIKPQEFPALRWRWRALQLPTGADERATKTNDSAAAVYVIFDNQVVPRVIKYVWSSTLPVGTQIDSPVYWRAKVVVLQSGPSNKGEWRQETVNFYKDYKTLFGAEPGEVQGIAVLTDSDMTGTVAEADYTDFALLSGQTVAAQDSGRQTTGLASAVARRQ
jgi:DUF3047 family protein